MSSFKLEHLDHVAIIVNDIDISANWYEKVLGLKRVEFPKWNGVPIFMLSGNVGVALFPAINLDDVKKDTPVREIKIDHFAFQVSLKNFQKAKAHYKKLNQPFRYEDHDYFQSIYTFDPDGHEVELTTITEEGIAFFRNL